MVRQDHLDPSAFFLEAGPTGVLLLHGFTGSPPELRLLGGFLHAHGFTVSAPLLPGHGTTVEDLNDCQWTDWTHGAEQAYLDLQSRCEGVFVGGLSMGSLLVIDLAARHHLAGAMLYSPAVKVSSRLIYLAPVLKHLVPKRPKSGETDLTDLEAQRHCWSYEAFPSFAAHELLKLIRRAHQALPRVTCPLLIIHSTGDEMIRADSAQFAYERAASSDKQLITLHNSGHVITVDTEWTTVAEATHRFIEAQLLAAA